MSWRLLRLYLLQPQIIHNHVAAECYPAVTEPHHLALVRRRHGLPSRSYAAVAQPVEEHQRSRVLLVLEVAAEGPRRDRGHDVDEAGVLPQYRYRGKGVEVDGGLPAVLPAHEAGDEGARAVVEARVVRVARHAAGVEGYEDVDRRGRAVGLRGGAGLEVRREGGRQERLDLGRVPGRRHAVLEVGALDHEDVLLAAQAEGHAALGELLLARLAQALCVACGLTWLLVCPRQASGEKGDAPLNGERTAAQTQDLDVVAGVGPRQRQHRGREEHGLVIGVGDEEAYPLVAQGGEPRLHDRDGVQVQRRYHDGHDSERKQPVHRFFGRLFLLRRRFVHAG